MLSVRHLTAVAAVACTAALAPAQAAQDPVTIYSSRIENLLKPTLDRYTQETGVPVRLLTDNGNALMERLAAEGRGTPADLLITVDVGNLWRAADRGLLRSIQSESLENDIPPALRDPDGFWYGLSRRERTIFYNPDLVDASELSTYEDLATPKWEGKLCLRTSKQTYTQSLTAMLLAEHGAEKTEEIVRGWVRNLATDVFTSDTRMLEAIAAGQCPVALVNTYYYGRLTAQDASFPERVKLFWANQGEGEGGAHVNLSGGGITAHAKNPEGAQKLLEWLASAEAQTGYTHGTYEGPVNPAVAPDPIVKSWGTFTPNTINAAEIGSLQPEAILLLDRAGYR